VLKQSNLPFGYKFVEDVIENYEPEQSEIEGYAGQLGMDLENDSHLLYIAKEGLKARLPDSWEAC